MKAIRLLDLASKAFRANDNEIVEVGNRINETIVNSSRYLMFMPNIRATREPTLLISNAKKAFNPL